MIFILKKIGKVFFFGLIFLLGDSLTPNPILSGEKRLINSVGMEFILIPAGTFIMGSPLDEPDRDKNEPQHQVILSRPFYLQVTEVTLGQWQELMGKRFFERRKGKGDIPVSRVSWFDCSDLISKLNKLNEGNYRLPTEAEWEYACRAGSTTAYTWGPMIDCNKARYGGSKECEETLKSKGFSPNGPAPVKGYQPNAWGLYDMHGNLWEWCQDWLGNYPSHVATDPKGPDSGTNKVRRGGSWFKYGYYCRSANRTYAHPASRLQTTGLRVVREAP